MTTPTKERPTELLFNAEDIAKIIGDQLRFSGVFALEDTLEIRLPPSSYVHIKKV